MTHDAHWHELQYNPRLTVPNAGAIIPDWRKRASATREKYPPHCDYKYGPHPRETVDVFHAPNAKGTVIYIHGGYWRMLSKFETSFVAEHYVAQGYSVVLFNYPLCPDVTVRDIRTCTQRAFKYVWQQLLTKAERAAIVVAGHSAGGHLAAYLATVDWSKHGVTENPIAAIVSLSGIFDVAPLIHTSMNVELRLTPEIAEPLNLLQTTPRTTAKLLCAVGADEPEEFHRQSNALAKAWSHLDVEFQSCEATNHFTIVDRFSNPDAAIFKTVLGFLTR